MIINPLAIASKGYIGNKLPLTIASKGYIDLSGARAKTPSIYIRNRAQRRTRFR